MARGSKRYYIGTRNANHALTNLCVAQGVDVIYGGVLEFWEVDGLSTRRIMVYKMAEGEILTWEDVE